MSARMQIVDLSCGYCPCSVLEGVNLEIRAGEVLALIGPNGSGKTTLLHTISRLLRPQKGEVLIDGKSIWTMKGRECARLIALAPQRAVQSSWPLTVGDAVALGRAPHRGWLLPLTGDDRNEVENAMARMGVEKMAHRSVSTLSGGEVRRVILARALAQKPQVMLLDEPTTYLDIRYQAELLGIVKELARQDGMAVVLTVHDLMLAALCADRVALLGQHRLQAIGKPDEVLRAEVLKPVYGDNLEVLPHPASGLPLVLPVPSSARPGTF